MVEEVTEQAELDPQEDRRADLEAAIASSESEATETVSESPDTPSDSPAGEEPVSEQATPDLDEEEPPRQRKQKGPSAPVDWSAELKAGFGTLPEPVQKAIHQREVHINRVLQESAESRRMAESVVRTVEPYRAMMVAEGVNDPMQAIDGLLKTAATLSMGSQSQKAQRLAQLVQHYGVDIETLDKALAGSLPKNTEEDRVNNIVNQRIGQYEQQQRQQQEQAERYYAEQNANMTVEQMSQDPQFPHFEDVREIMADFVDVATAHGQQYSLDDFYQRACMMVPHIAQQVIQERSGSFMQGQQQRVDQKRNAASSITGKASSNSSGGSALGEMSLRDALAAQMGGGGRI